MYVNKGENPGSASTRQWLHVIVEYSAVQTDEDKVIDDNGTTAKMVIGKTTITITDMDGNVLSTGGCEYGGQDKKIMPLVSEANSCGLAFQYKTVADIYLNNFQLYKVYDASLEAAD
jgi:hypothetical protein